MINNIMMIDPVAFQLGSFEVYWYAIIIMIGIFIGIGLGLKEAERFGLDEDDLLTAIIILVPLSIIGARLYFVLFNWDYYKGSGEIFAIHDGGMAIHGGIIVAFLGSLVFCKIKKINPLLFLDGVVPSLLIGQAIGRWGNFINQEAHGPEVDKAFLTDTLHLPEFIVEGMNIGGTYYHPTFLYESIWNISGFIIILNIRRSRITRAGELLAFYLIWYGFGRFIIEALRTDSLFIGETGLKTNQVSSLIMMVMGILFIVFNRIFKFSKEYYVDEIVN